MYSPTEEDKKITNKLVAITLDGLPLHKLHCSNLGAGPLTLAIKNYQEKSVAPSKAGAPRIPRPGAYPVNRINSLSVSGSNLG